MRLLLIRHGQTPSNVEGILDADYPGPGLTALGATQAEAVPSALAHESISGLHVSRLLRTHETAAPMAAALGMSPRLTQGLEEISAGDFEMRRDEDAVEAYQDNQARWSGGDLTGGLPGGETGEQFWARYTGALRHIAGLYAEDATVAVVSHGAAIRVFASVVGELGAATRHDRPLFNTGMVTLTGHPDQGWTLEDWVSEPIGGGHLLGSIEHDITADQDAEAAV
ncbi:histidine phosphatase family protein [uncultured Brachybacterium sp.]|uniref:histidine phosphatase family protein n=1 Tax=uncultured Brachybacterium sp. TaxID=189680 RepID=UPI0026071306|nr:histidine phosphatase family protein [uncultured Brachybacterium sp.]